MISSSHYQRRRKKIRHKEKEIIMRREGKKTRKRSRRGVEGVRSTWRASMNFGSGTNFCVLPAGLHISRFESSERFLSTLRVRRRSRTDSTCLLSLSSHVCHILQRRREVVLERQERERKVLCCCSILSLSLLSRALSLSLSYPRFFCPGISANKNLLSASGVFFGT